MTNDVDLLAPLRTRTPGYTLPRGFYTDPAIYQLDLEHIFYRQWLFIGHDCELPSVGSFMTAQIGEYPILIIRDKDLSLHAFHNTCRHRGSRICSQEHGTAVKLVCPYHQWTYSLDGRLFSARQMGENFDRSSISLRSLRVESVAGYIFACIADDAPDFAPIRAHIEPYLAPHRLQDAKIARQMTIIEHGNWKLVWENNRECYHCAANHPELCITFPEDPASTGVGSVRTDPAMTAHWQRCESAGLPSAFKISANGQVRTTRTPLLNDSVSYTMSGNAAVRRPLVPSLGDTYIGAFLMFNYPSLWNHVLVDHAISFRVSPLSATQTQVTTKWMVHRDAVEGVDYDIDDLTRVWVATNDADRRIVEENQRGIFSPAYQIGPYSTVHEDGVMQFVDWYCRTMTPRDARGERLRAVGASG